MARLLFCLSPALLSAGETVFTDDIAEDGLVLLQVAARPHANVEETTSIKQCTLVPQSSCNALGGGSKRIGNMIRGVNAQGCQDACTSSTECVAALSLDRGGPKSRICMIWSSCEVKRSSRQSPGLNLYQCEDAVTTTPAPVVPAGNRQCNLVPQSTCNAMGSKRIGNMIRGVDAQGCQDACTGPAGCVAALSLDRGGPKSRICMIWSSCEVKPSSGRTVGLNLYQCEDAVTTTPAPVASAVGDPHITSIGGTKRDLALIDYDALVDAITGEDPANDVDAFFDSEDGEFSDEGVDAFEDFFDLAGDAAQ